MPIGCTRPIDDGEQADHADRHTDARRSTHQAGVEPLPFAPRGLADGAVALVQLPHHAVGAVNDLDRNALWSFALKRRQRGGGGFQLGLVHAFRPRDIALRLLDFLAQAW